VVGQTKPGGAVPVPAHPAAYVDDQVTTKFWPAGTLDGVIDIVAVGEGGGSTVTVTGDDVAWPTIVSNGSQVTVNE
jgi:hypothetical protein